MRLLLVFGCVCMHMRVFVISVCGSVCVCARMCLCVCVCMCERVCVLSGYVMFISTVVMEPNSTVQECTHGHQLRVCVTVLV